MRTIAVDRQAIGIVSGEAAGVPLPGALGADLWRNTPRSRVETALMGLPAADTSPALRSLKQRLLASPAMPPAGPARQPLLDLRASLLWHMGEVETLRRLIDAVPVQYRSKAMTRLDVEARLLAGDPAACDIAAVEVERDPAAFWQQVLVFCHARAGDHAKAMLGLDLLREQGADEVTFTTLIHGVLGEPVALGSLAEVTPLLLAVAQAAKLPLPSDVGTRASLPVLAAVARLPNVPAAARLKAADRAAAVGAFPVDLLRELYGMAEATAKPADDTAEGRAARYREVLTLTAPPARAEALARALTEARGQGRLAVTARLYAALLAAMQPLPEVLPLAADIVPALLLIDDRAAAETWLRATVAGAEGDEETARALVRVLPTAVLAGLPPLTAADDDALDAWSAATRSAGGAATVARVLALLDALGESVSDALIDEALTTRATAVAALPSPVALAVLRRAAADRRVGETVLLSLIVLADRGAAGSDTTTLAIVVEALRAVGLAADARALAVEGVTR